MSFEIDPRNVSHADIKSAIEAKIAVMPDADKWSDFFTSGAGQLVTNLIASLGALLSHNIIVGRREAYHRYAKNRSSVVAGSAMLGYSAQRGRNTILQITFVPTVTGTIPKWTLMGTVKDRSLILEEDVVVNSGVEATVRVIVGTIRSETVVAPTAQPYRFQFTKPNVSQDIRIYLNDSEIEFGDRIVDLVDGQFIPQTNAFGSVDVSHLNLDSFDIRYSVGSRLRLDWIELYNLSFQLSDVKWTSGTMTDLLVATQFNPTEDIESVRINGPLANETQYTIRGRDDYLKIMKLTIPSLADVKGLDANPAIVRLFYVKPDTTLYSAAEKVAIQNQLSIHRPFGIMPPDIADPEIVFYDIDVTAKTSGIGPVVADINEIVDSMERKLGFELSFDDAENAIESLSYIQVARVANKPLLWSPNTSLRKGALLLPSANAQMAWRVGRVIYRSGPVEPQWPISVGAVVEDNKILWRAREKRPENNVPWAPNSDYQRRVTALDPSNSLVDKGPSGDVIVPSAPIGVPPVGATATFAGVVFTATTIGSIGNNIALVFDNSKTINEVVDAWNLGHLTNQVSFSGVAGDTILPGATVELSGGHDFIPVDLEFEVIGYVNRSSTDIPATPATGTYTGILFTAVTPGTSGNFIALNFDGSMTVAEAKAAWNNGNTGNQVTSLTSSDPIVPPAGTLQLSGGSDFYSGEPAWPSSGIC